MNYTFKSFPISISSRISSLRIELQVKEMTNLPLARELVKNLEKNFLDHIWSPEDKVREVKTNFGLFWSLNSHLCHHGNSAIAGCMKTETS